MITLFHNLQIEYKILICHLILISLPTLVLIFLYGTQMQENIYTQTITQEQALSSQTSLTLTSSLDQVKKISASIQESSLIQRIIENSSNVHNTSELNLDFQLFYQLVQTLTEGDLVTNIRVFTDYSPSYAEHSTILSPLSETNGTYWNGIFNSTNKSELYCPSFYLSDYETSNLGTLCYIVKIEHSHFTNSPTYIAIYFSQSEIENILMQNIPNNTSFSYIVNERNSIIASSNYQLVGTYLMSYAEILNNAVSSNSYIINEVLGENFYTGCYRLGNSDWYMVSILPIAPLELQGKQIIGKFFLIYLCLLIIAFIIANKLSASITLRIKSLAKQMENVLGERPTKMPQPLYKDEIGALITTYNYMADEINLLLTKEAESAESLRISEFQALQAQINPHFLYNTMDMINWLSQSGRNKEVTNAIHSLSSFYKLTLSKNTIITTIETEAQHVSLYVTLQNMRFENKIDFLIDIPDNLLQHTLPKLTFQPIVENAILHGILEKNSVSGSIVITGWIEDQTVVLLISDNGVGIPSDKLIHLLDGAASNTKGSNIGIFNTHKRLKTLYGQDYGLIYHSTIHVGTDVEIRIPLQKESTTPTTKVDSNL